MKRQLICQQSSALSCRVSCYAYSQCCAPSFTTSYFYILVKDRCHFNPCKNGGLCHEGMCTCIGGYTGDSCEGTINVFLST